MKFLFLCIIYFGGNMCCNAAELFNPEKVEAAIDSGDTTFLDSIQNRLESEWGSANKEYYFNQCRRLCNILSNKCDTREKAEMLGRIIRYVISKNIWDDRELEFLLPQTECVVALTSIPKAIAKDEAGIRSITLRLLMVYRRQLKAKIIVNYKKREVYLNIVPPVGESHEIRVSGMDPKSIKDPSDRKKYEEELKQNEENRLENNRQGMMRQVWDLESSRIDDFIVSRYTKIPIDLEEMNDLLTLGSYSVEERKVLLKSVCKSASVETPKWIDRMEN